MREAVKFIKEMRFHLPPFACWTVKEWQSKGPEIQEIIENQLGWDITDFGRGDFYKYGLILFTLRNGKFKDASKHAKPYCEKILIVEENQNTPLHHHFSKKEDIINRGGGTLQVEIYKTDDNDQLSEKPVSVYIDGIRKTFEAGSIIELNPGESIYLTPDIYHRFWAKNGSGKVLIGEVSTVNDDYMDNKFHEEVKRFSDIKEDEEPLYLLYNDYKNYLKIN